MQKHKEIKEQLSKEGDRSKVNKYSLLQKSLVLRYADRPLHLFCFDTKSTNITKLVSEAWKAVSPEEKAKYEQMARDDKKRYDIERSNYKDERGNLIANKKKLRDPNAPKRPMSAFLAFANSRRAEVKAQNPNGSNGEISKILSKMWKEAPTSVQQEYRGKEAAQWATYKGEMTLWRKKNDGRKKGSRILQGAAGNKDNNELKNKGFDEERSLAESTFDEQFGTFGASGFDHLNPNQDGQWDFLLKFFMCRLYSTI